VRVAAGAGGPGEAERGRTDEDVITGAVAAGEAAAGEAARPPRPRLLGARPLPGKGLLPPEASAAGSGTCFCKIFLGFAPASFDDEAFERAGATAAWTVGSVVGQSSEVVHQNHSVSS
jgi:hypothetical protein